MVVLVVLACRNGSDARLHASPFYKQLLNNDCHSDCTARGNCDGATGRCECPFGLNGE